MNMSDFADTVILEYSAKLYSVYMTHIDQAMDRFKETGEMRGDVAGFLVISGDSLIAARYREVSDAYFDRDGVVLVGLEKCKVKDCFDNLTRHNLEEINFEVGIPVLIFYKGDFDLRYLDFQINDEDADRIIKVLFEAIQDETQVRKVYSSVREYHLRKDEENHEDNHQ